MIFLSANRNNRPVSSAQENHLAPDGKELRLKKLVAISTLKLRSFLSYNDLCYTVNCLLYKEVASS